MRAFSAMSPMRAVVISPCASGGRFASVSVLTTATRCRTSRGRSSRRTAESKTATSTVRRVALRSGMWAVLFTDVVGSTEQRARLGDDVGDALRREHDTIVARVLAIHHGERVEGTGDGAMCAFASAADAVAAGVALQQG